jgi:phosphoribosylformylglycinamidine synthase
VQGLKTGTPPRCDLEKEKNLHLALRALIHAGSVKSAHDCSEGGLAVALAECCISRHIARETPQLLGAQVDLSTLAPAGTRLDALLFGETQGRIVLTVNPLDAVKVVERAKLLGVAATRIGTVFGENLALKTASGDFSWPVAELHDLWWNAIARAMR